MKNVVLLKKHKHNGILYDVGTVLTMNERIADWVIAQGIARQSDSLRLQNRPAPQRIKRGCCGGRW